MYIFYELWTVTLEPFRGIYRLALALEQFTVWPALLTWPGLPHTAFP